MVSSNDTIIIKIANSIVSKINSLIGNHNSSNTAHSDIRNSIPTTTNQLTNNSGFLTSQDISGKANTADLATVATTGSYNDLTNKPSTFTPTSHTHGSISNTGTLNSPANNVNNIVVTDNSNNIKVVSGLDYDFINFADNYTGINLIESDNEGGIGAIGIWYDTTADEIVFPTLNLYDLGGNQLATLTDIPSASNFITKTSSNNLLLANGNNIPQSTFLTQHQDISGKLNTADLVDELNNVVLDLIDEGEE